MLVTVSGPVAWEVLASFAVSVDVDPAAVEVSGNSNGFGPKNAGDEYGAIEVTESGNVLTTTLVVTVSVPVNVLTVVGVQLTVMVQL